MREEWKNFKSGKWVDTIDVDSFIQENYVLYDGDESFLEGTTNKTDKIWGEC